MDLAHKPELVERVYPVKAHYFLGSAFLGSSSFNNPNCLPYSEAFFCATCGEVWGRVQVENSPWYVRTVPCEKHQPTGCLDWSSVPGSFLQPTVCASETSVMFWATVLEHLPAQVLERDLGMLIRHLQRKHHQS